MRGRMTTKVVALLLALALLLTAAAPALAGGKNDGPGGKKDKSSWSISKKPNISWE